MPQYATTRYITAGGGAVQPSGAVAYAAVPSQVAQVSVCAVVVIRRSFACATMFIKYNMYCFSFLQAMYSNAGGVYTTSAPVMGYATAAAAGGTTAVYADPYQQATLTPTAHAVRTSHLS